MKNEKQKGKMKKWKSNRFAKVKKSHFQNLNTILGQQKSIGPKSILHLRSITVKTGVTVLILTGFTTYTTVIGKRVGTFVCHLLLDLKVPRSNLNKD